MDTWFYEVVSIDGDYANLKRTDIESDDLKLVARALLPAEIKEGSKLRYEMLTYYMFLLRRVEIIAGYDRIIRNRRKTEDEHICGL